MVWSNYHSHCTFCDGRSTMEEFVKFAISKGIRKYGFSSHAPLPFLTKWTMKEDDFQDYEEEFYRLKNKYSSEIELLLGLEIDFIHNCSSIKNQFFKNISLDYTIGSIHYLDKMKNGEYWSIDGAFDEFDAGLNEFYEGDIKMATQRFFEVTGLMIELAGFDIVGHFDKIIYHGRKYADFSVTENWFTNLMIENLELIKSKNLILEINTKSLREHGITYPHKNFYSLINDLDIPIVVNSDCHYPTNVTDNFKPVYKRLKQAGFKTMHQLINRKWEAVEFTEAGLLF